MSTETTVLTLLEAAYYGTGGFEFGAQDGILPGNADTREGSYLVQHPREHKDNYNARRKVAYYLNYMAPVVDSHVSPVFRREAARTAKGRGEALWEAFAKDADGSGNSLAEVMRAAAMPAQRDGIHVLVVTAPETAPRTAAEALELRPYIYGVAALDIAGLERDRFGRIVKLSHWEAMEGQDKPVIRELRPDGWQILNDKGERLDGGQFATSYTTAPVVELRCGSMVRGQKLPRSNFVAIARCCHRLFNLCSELDEIFRSQTFSILLYPSKDLSSLTIGTNNALGFDGDGKHAPGYIAPPDGPAKLLMEQIDRLVREIYRMALLTHQTGSTNTNQQQNLASGVALRIDREALDTALSDFARLLESAEVQIAALWSWWTGEALEYEVSYPRDFVLQDASTMLAPLFDAFTTLAAGMPKALRAGIFEKIGNILLEDDETRLEELRNELDQDVVDTQDPPTVDPQDGQDPTQQDGQG